MADTIFREKSMDRLKSPEHLNEYIRVARPGVWIALGAAILVLAGAIAWAVFGIAESRIRTPAFVKDGAATCYLTQEDAAEIKPGMPVEIAGVKTRISAVSDAPVSIAELNPALAELGGFDDSHTYYTAAADVPNAGDGLNFAEITIERIKPITFITH